MTDKAPHVANFQRATVNAAIELMGITGVGCDRERLRSQIYRRTGMNNIQSLAEIYPCFEPEALLQGQGPEFYQKAWQQASAESF